MAATQALSKMQQSGGALGKQPEAATMCAAFKDAVKQWCDEKAKGQKHNGDFNDYFFRKLYNTPGGRAADLLDMRAMREAVFLNPYGGGAAQAIASTAGGGVGVAGAGAAQLAFGGGGAAASAFRATVMGAWKGLWSSGRPMFPDSMLRGTPVEIKGPNDTLSTKQAKKYQKIKGKGQLIVVSCQSCKASCASTNKC
jgi:hypothetical protein